MIHSKRFDLLWFVGVKGPQKPIECNCVLYLELSVDLLLALKLITARVNLFLLNFVYALFI